MDSNKNIISDNSKMNNESLKIKLEDLEELPKEEKNELELSNNKELEEKKQEDEKEGKKLNNYSDFFEIEDEDEMDRSKEDYDKFSINEINSKANLGGEIGEQVIRPVSTEEIFLQQKEKIKKIKDRNNTFNYDRYYLSMNNKKEDNENDNVNINANFKKEKGKAIKIFNGNFKILTLNDYLFFETATFTQNKAANKDDKIPLLKNVIWNSLTEPIKNNEFKKIALRTINEVNYNTNGVEINVNFSLEGSSELWIFTRCFINKAVNESFIFDTSSINNEPNIVFNKYSSLIKIVKKRNSNRSFVNFGTFYEDSNNSEQVIYKTFLKRQLVDFNENNIGFLTDTDVCEFNAFILDMGSEIIDVKIAMNLNHKFNHVIGNFYLPTNKRSKILFCGVGQSVKVKNLRINNFAKSEREIGQQYETTFSSEQKNCSCCIIM